MLRGMIAVPYFEKALYELDEADLTAENIERIADEIEHKIQGGLAARPLLSVPAHHVGRVLLLLPRVRSPRWRSIRPGRTSSASTASSSTTRDRTGDAQVVLARGQRQARVPQDGAGPDGEALGHDAWVAERASPPRTS